MVWLVMIEERMEADNLILESKRIIHHSRWSVFFSGYEARAG